MTIPHKEALQSSKSNFEVLDKKVLLLMKKMLYTPEKLR